MRESSRRQNSLYAETKKEKHLQKQETIERQRLGTHRNTQSSHLVKVERLISDRVNIFRVLNFPWINHKWFIFRNLEMDTEDMC